MDAPTLRLALIYGPSPGKMNCEDSVPWKGAGRIVVACGLGGSGCAVGGRTSGVGFVRCGNVLVVFYREYLETIGMSSELANISPRS